MAKPGSPSNLAFSSIVVTLVVATVYIAIAIPLLLIEETVPKAPSQAVPFEGLNLTEAWLDLSQLSSGYHPYNSRKNDEVRDWLLRRIGAILEENRVQNWSTESSGSLDGLLQKTSSTQADSRWDEEQAQKSSDLVTVFNDLTSNVTASATGTIAVPGKPRQPGISTYFEGTNLIVYIRGTEDEPGDWWNAEGNHKHHGKGGVLLNAHYDSVSTGFGATDTGMGVITVLQMIRYFTTSGNQPKKGVIALLNNGEEDFLNGARAFTQHPLSQFAYTFVNLEGAGAGGRLTLLRSTDTEVTKAYATAPHPFGTVIGADGFKSGFVRSGTDYEVFQNVLGSRGLDVSFWYPRARYHTDQDDARHTNKDSLWHMLSVTLSSMKYLTSDTGSTFEGPRSDGSHHKLSNGQPTDAVWFDLFGQVFAVFELRGLFAWSITLLVATPIILLVIMFLLARQDKLYLFASRASESAESIPIDLFGWRGVFRFPVALVVSTGLTVGSAFLIRKVNPLIVYSSHYAVWTMMLCLDMSVFWFIMKGADVIRPSALARVYTLIWLFDIGWVVVVATTVFEDRFQIASGYLFVMFQSAVFLATLISLCEMFALPSKQSYLKYIATQHDNRDQINSLPGPDVTNTTLDDEDNGEEPSESTPLFGDRNGNGSRITTFANYARRSLGGVGEGDGTKDVYDALHKPYGDEQGWSGRLPAWTWLVQFLLIGPFMFIIFGQVGLFLIKAVAQTGTDGGSLLVPYLLIALVSTLLILPAAPFTHRITHHIPSFLFLVFIGTLIYSLVAFPFSANNRYKAYFQQAVDLETGQNRVYLVGLEDYIRPIIASIPSASGQDIVCDQERIRPGLTSCSWVGPAPKVVDNIPEGVPPEKGYAAWLTYNVTRARHTNRARFEVQGQNTKACVLYFERPISDFHVHGSSRDPRLDAVPEAGSKSIRLWHRNWDRAWTVDVEWPEGEGKQAGEEGMEGRVVCLWSDDNIEGVIPALDEVRKFAPPWSSVSKLSDGLVEGSKPFLV